MPFANPTKENDALIAWDGTKGYPRDVGSAISVGFVFEVMTTLTADAVFGFSAYDPLSTNPCLPDPASAAPEQDKPLCWMIGVGPLPTFQNAQIAIPSGTVAGTKIGVNLRCYGKQFSGITSVSGPTSSLMACFLAVGLHSPR